MGNITNDGSRLSKGILLCSRDIGRRITDSLADHLFNGRIVSPEDV
jgi:hypothetical protein